MIAANMLELGYTIAETVEIGERTFNIEHKLDRNAGLITIAGGWKVIEVRGSSYGGPASMNDGEFLDYMQEINAPEELMDRLIGGSIRARLQHMTVGAGK